MSEEHRRTMDLAPARARRGRPARVLACGLSALSLPGCFVLRYDLPEALPPAAAIATPSQHFALQEKTIFCMGGVATYARADVGRMLQRASGGRPVANLRVRSETTVPDALLANTLWLTWALVGGFVSLQTGNALIGASVGTMLGLFTPTSFTITVEGDVAAP